MPSYLSKIPIPKPIQKPPTRATHTFHPDKKLRVRLCRGPSIEIENTNSDVKCRGSKPGTPKQGKSGSEF